MAQRLSQNVFKLHILPYDTYPLVYLLVSRVLYYRPPNSLLKRPTTYMKCVAEILRSFLRYRWTTGLRPRLQKRRLGARKSKVREYCVISVRVYRCLRRSSEIHSRPRALLVGSWAAHGRTLRKGRNFAARDSRVLWAFGVIVSRDLLAPR